MTYTRNGRHPCKIADANISPYIKFKSKGILISHFIILNQNVPACS
jgi:hypothetical protein